MKIRNELESQNVPVFTTIYSGPFDVQKSEINEIKFWSPSELLNSMTEKLFIPNCIFEIKLFLRNIRM